MTLRSPSGRLACWALQLQPYNLTIEYTPGKANVVADTLSRPPITNRDACLISVDLPTTTAKALRTQQMTDPDVRKILEAFDHEDSEGITQWTTRGYLVTQGVLCRYTPDGDNEEAQLVAPASDRERILGEHHNSPTAGHYGVDKTYHRISRPYYWPGMRQTITEYLKNCPICQRYKVTNLKPAGLLQTSAMNQRFETLAIDLFGPLFVSQEKR